MTGGADKLKRVKSGDPLSAAQANLINRLLKREVTGPGIFADSTGWHFRLPLEVREGFWARLTAENVGGYYSWARLEDDAETLVVPSITGTSDAKEVNATTDIPVNAVVWMWLDKTDYPWEYRFAYEEFFSWGIIQSVAGAPNYPLIDGRTALEKNGNVMVPVSTVVLVRETIGGEAEFEYQTYEAHKVTLTGEVGAGVYTYSGGPPNRVTGQIKEINTTEGIENIVVLGFFTSADGTAGAPAKFVYIPFEGGDLDYDRPAGGAADGWLLIDMDPASDFYRHAVHGDPQTTKLDTSLL